MKNIKILGTGCANCKTTYRMIEDAARAAGVEVELEKVEDMPEIMSYGVLSTPGVVVDGKLVHSGGLPSKESIQAWLAGEDSACCSGSSGGESGGGCCG